ncbi:hypothetical protein [Sulfitobacter aestuariivivens]|uniref:hypothetical protein n=1 Tax=Sulfitobacter aestuariivivens TaxID=2766981 RepID=UPI00361E106B
MSITSIQQRFSVAAAIGVSGGLVAAAITQADPTFRGDLGFCRCAAAGAFVAGLLLAGGFGRSGLWGLGIAALTFVGATLMGAVIAVMLLPVEALIADLGLRDLAVSISGMAAIAPIFVVEMVTSKGVFYCPGPQACWAFT